MCKIQQLLNLFLMIFIDEWDRKAFFYLSE